MVIDGGCEKPKGLGPAGITIYRYYIENNQCIIKYIPTRNEKQYYDTE